MVPKNRSSFPHVSCKQVSQAVVFLIQKERDTDPPTYFTPKTEVVISARTHHTHTTHTTHTEREGEREIEIERERERGRDRMYMCTHMYTYICTHINIYMCMYVFKNIYTYIYM